MAPPCSRVRAFVQSARHRAWWTDPHDCAGHVAEVHAGTPKSQTLANYPREFWQPSTTD
jgi:hypothetical protein